MTGAARQCRRCGSGDVYVVDSRPRVLGGAVGLRHGASPLSRALAAEGIEIAVVARRLGCARCDWRWTTVEVREGDLLGLVDDAAAPAARACA